MAGRRTSALHQILELQARVPGELLLRIVVARLLVLQHIKIVCQNWVNLKSTKNAGSSKIAYQRSSNRANVW